ncbi:MAG: hypothetical protein HYR88_16165 [Verrucomicrobia bacterium]|nr:hypothetical protein [Verrucomicrobiota bacterium]MBI3869604.1 hypothetical protein [Verrucomicrobiota bacterium]
MIKRVQAHSWEGIDKVLAQKAQMRALGFTEIGPFVCVGVSESESEFIAFYLPPAHFYGMLFAPREDTIPIELCCQISCTSGVSVTNSAAIEPWHRPPHGVLMRIARAPMGMLLRTLLDKVAGLDREAACPDMFEGDFTRYRLTVAHS